MDTVDSYSIRGIDEATEVAYAEATDPRKLPVIFDVYGHARRSEFKYLPSADKASWRSVPPLSEARPAHAMPVDGVESVLRTRVSRGERTGARWWRRTR